MVALDKEGVFLAVDVTACLDFTVRAIFARMGEREKIGLLFLKVKKPCSEESGEFTINIQ
jgi:hypothetical protein